MESNSQEIFEEYPLSKIAVSSLQFDSTNPNKPTREQIAAVKRSFRRFGYLVPIIVNENMQIGDGEHRALIYKEMGLQTIPGYIVPKINDDIERRLLRQTMNKLRGEHDIKLDADEIALIFQNDKLEHLSELIGQDQRILENILSKHKGIHFQHEDDFNVEKTLDELVPTTQLGDMWQLGEHRIICADCSDERSMHKLMKNNSVKADMIITSPPYDELRDYEHDFDFNTVSNNLFQILEEDSAMVWIVGDQTNDGSESGTSFRQALAFKELGFKLHDTMIYEKTGFAKPMNTRYHQMFEYMFVFIKGKLKTFNPIMDHLNETHGQSWVGTMRQTDGSMKLNNISKSDMTGMRGNIWRYENQRDNHLPAKHPAIFPLELAKDHIATWSNEQEIMLDPFLGSGTSLIACEQSNRICFGIELSPLFVDLAIKRWEAYTNNKAELIRSGERNLSI